MFRTIVVGVVALGAVVAVLGMVFALGALRIRMADNGSAAAVASTTPNPPPASQPSAAVELTAQDAPAEAVPAMDFSIVELPAENAKLSPGLLLLEDKLARPPRPGRARKGHVGLPDVAAQARHAITGWRSDQDIAEWTATLPKPGVYEIDIVCASINSKTKSPAYVVTLGDQELNAQTEPGSLSGTSYKMLTAGNVTLPGGEIRVRFHPAANCSPTSLRLQSIRLIPAS